MKTLSAVMILIMILLFSGEVARGGGDDLQSVNREAVKADLSLLASRAQHYYRTPSILGGGQGDFDGLTLSALTTKAVKANGSYCLTSAAGQTAVIEGYGTEVGDDVSTVIHITANVLSDSSYFIEVN